MVKSYTTHLVRWSGLSDTTHAKQDYLKAIYKLQQEERPVLTMTVAEALDLSSAAVSKMLKHLAAQGLVEHSRYYGVALTEAGEKITLEVIRHHRSVELYLVNTLGVPWDQVDREAEDLEHVLLEELEERMATVSGDPKRDLHGDPSPGLDGTLEEPARTNPADLDEGSQARVLRVPDRDPQFLRYFAKISLVPEIEVYIARREPYIGPLHIPVGQSQTQHVSGREIVERIFVSRRRGYLRPEV